MVAMDTALVALTINVPAITESMESLLGLSLIAPEELAQSKKGKIKLFGFS